MARVAAVNQLISKVHEWLMKTITNQISTTFENSVVVKDSFKQLTPTERIFWVFYTLIVLSEGIFKFTGTLQVESAYHLAKQLPESWGTKQVFEASV